MKLTGKASESFKKWMRNCKFKQLELNDHADLYEVFDVSYIFEQLPQSMKYGVYVDWFDSVGLDLSTERYCDFDMVYIDMYEWSVHTTDDMETGFGGYEKTRPEARTEAINKANTIYNESLKTMLLLSQKEVPKDAGSSYTI